MQTRKGKDNLGELEHFRQPTKVTVVGTFHVPFTRNQSK